MLIKNSREIKVSYGRVRVYYKFSEQIVHEQKVNINKFKLIHLVIGPLYANTKNGHFILLKQFRKTFC